MVDITDISNINVTSGLSILMPYLKWFAIMALACFLVIVGFILIIYLTQRKWHVEIHEQKADGKIHTVGFDKLIEKKINKGTTTVYWLTKAKQEAIPPPDECVDRIKRREEVDYLRVSRDYVPCYKTMSVNYEDPRVKRKLIPIYDNIIQSIRKVKTTYFHSDPVREKYIYIPINKTLTSNMVFTPIDYDVSMMAMNEIHNADEFYASKYEWWKKYGGIVILAMVVVFLLIVVILTFTYVKDIVSMIMAEASRTTGALELVAEKFGSSGAKPPS